MDRKKIESIDDALNLAKCFENTNSPFSKGRLTHRFNYEGTTHPQVSIEEMGYNYLCRDGRGKDCQFYKTLNDEGMCMFHLLELEIKTKEVYKINLTP